MLEKGTTHFNEQGMDLNELVEMKLAPDMGAFPFQVNLVSMVLYSIEDCGKK